MITFRRHCRMWLAFGTSLPDPQCSVSITQTATAADILWKTS